MNLKEKRAQVLAEAHATVNAAKADGRDLTPAEVKAVEDATAEAVKLGEQLEKVAESEALVARLGALGKQLYDPNDSGSINPGWGVEGRGYLRLKTDSGRAAHRMVSQIGRDSQGRKALTGAGVVTTQLQFDPTPIPLGQPATSLFDVLPSNLRTVPVYAYLQQLTRTNNAAVVLPGALKPTSVYTIGSVSNQLDVVAHLSEPMDEYMLADNDSLAAFVQSELIAGLQHKVETIVAADLLAQSGVQTQAYAVDRFATTRTAITALSSMGVAAGFWLVNPTDWLALELSKDADGHYYVGQSTGPLEVAAKRLWSTPVVETSAVAAGTAWLIGDGAVELSHDGQISVKWAAAVDDFEKNLVRARCEGRFATDVPRPWAVVKTALA